MEEIAGCCLLGIREGLAVAGEEVDDADGGVMLGLGSPLETVMTCSLLGVPSICEGKLASITSMRGIVVAVGGDPPLMIGVLVPSAPEEDGDPSCTIISLIALSIGTMPSTCTFSPPLSFTIVPLVCATPGSVITGLFRLVST